MNRTALPFLRRRPGGFGLLGVALLLAGCAASSPPVQLHRLAAAPPVAELPRPADRGAVWHLVLPVRVPEYLDREALLLPQPGGGLQGQPGQRWAESLRDAVPRLLRQDLGLMLGEARVWPTPLPPGVAATRQLRVELLALDVRPDRSAVELRARWSVVEVDSGRPPRAESAQIIVDSGGPEVGRLVAAHRLALWRLAERIAATP